MKVVILGSGGMLGSDLYKVLKDKGYYVVGLDLPDLDITDHKNVREVVPVADWIINCAAYTRVDDAEKEYGLAFKINSDGARNIARFCERKRVRLMHISTDYVFDGRSRRAYDESDVPNPLNLYGSSKLAGEKAIRAEGGRFLIVRTQALFGACGRNFVAAVADRMQHSEPIEVIDDQITSPTYTVHLSQAIVHLLNMQRDGIVHLSSSGECSWYDFARAIAARVAPGALVHRKSTSEIDYPARRPAYAVLDKGRYQTWVGNRMPSWEEGLDAYLQEVGLPASSR